MTTTDVDSQLPVEIVLGFADGARANDLRETLSRRGYATRVVTDPQRATVVMKMAVIHLVMVDHLAADGQGADGEMITELLDDQHESFRILLWREAIDGRIVDAINQGDIDALLPDPEPEAPLLDLLLRGTEVARKRWRHARMHRELIRRNRQLEAFNANLENEVRSRTRSLQQANQQLRHYQDELVHLETQATLTHLVRGLAHEINNPLSVILGQTQRLQRMEHADERIPKRLDGIAAEVGRCIDLVNHLRSFSAGLRRALEPVSLEAAIDLARERLATGQRNCPAIRLAGPCPLLMADLESLARSLEQVLDNAAQAGARLVVIDPVRREDQVSLRITNDGATPDEEAVRNAVRPFFTSRGPEAAGLGLALAAALLREQSGTIVFDRNPTGDGALVVITLAMAPSGRRSGTSPFPRSHPSVLVIDDDPMTCELLVDAITERSLRAATVDGLSRAIAVAKIKPLSALCCGTCYGVEGIRMLFEALAPQLPAFAGRIILVGPAKDRQAVQPVMDEYRCSYLERPFKMDAARELLAKVLG